MSKENDQPDASKEVEWLNEHDDNYIKRLSEYEEQNYASGVKLDDAKNNYEISKFKHATSYLKLQQKYTRKLRHITIYWLIAVVITLLLEGFKVYGFHLDKSVLIAFITSTTASVIGLFILVAQWLFKKSN